MQIFRSHPRHTEIGTWKGEPSYLGFNKSSRWFRHIKFRTILNHRDSEAYLLHRKHYLNTENNLNGEGGVNNLNWSGQRKPSWGRDILIKGGRDMGEIILSPGTKLQWTWEGNNSGIFALKMETRRARVQWLWGKGRKWGQRRKLGPGRR